MPNTSLPGTAETDLIKAFIDLDVNTKTRVLRVLLAIAGEEPNMGNQNVSLPQADNGGTDQSELEAIAEWLETIAGLPNLKMVERIDEVLENVETTEAKEMLSARKSAILNADIPLAVRFAVSKYASQSPVMAIGAIGGVFVLIYAVGKAVFAAFK